MESTFALCAVYMNCNKFTTALFTLRGVYMDCGNIARTLKGECKVIYSTLGRRFIYRLNTGLVYTRLGIQPHQKKVSGLYRCCIVRSQEIKYIV